MKKMLNKRFILAFLLIGIGTLAIIYTFGIIGMPPITIPSLTPDTELITYEDLLANNYIETYATTLYLLLYAMEEHPNILILPLDDSDTGVRIRISPPVYVTPMEGPYEYTIIAHNNLSKLYLVTSRNWDHIVISSIDRIQTTTCLTGDGNDQIDYYNGVNTHCYLFGEEGDDLFQYGIISTEISDLFTGYNSGYNISFGGPGNDFSSEFSNYSIFIGGADNDVSGAGNYNIGIGCEGNDYLRVNPFADEGILIGCEGNDNLEQTVQEGNYYDPPTPEIDDLLIGGEGNDTLNGGERRDILLGQDHGDTLFGGLDDNPLNVVSPIEDVLAEDVLIGGNGMDTYYEEDVEDIILFIGSGEIVNPSPPDIEPINYLNLMPEGLYPTPPPTLPPLDTEVITSEELNTSTYIETSATIIYLFLYDWEESLNIQIKPRIGFNVGVKIGINQSSYVIMAQNNLDKLYIFTSKFADTVTADSGDRVQTTTCFLGLGNDNAICLNSINTNFYVLGEEGNDNLRSETASAGAVSIGAGYDIYLGCEGDDTIETLSDNCILIGGEGKDKITGHGYRNILIALGGNDNILLKKGPGGGILIGSKGYDLLLGANGDDILVGGKGIDWLQAQGGRDVLLGGSEKDWLFGGAGEDLLIGGGGPDRIYGGPGNDTILFTESDDTVNQ